MDLSRVTVRRRIPIDDLVTSASQNIFDHAETSRYRRMRPHETVVVEDPDSEGSAGNSPTMFVDSSNHFLLYV
jgi:hypothetical protein